VIRRPAPKAIDRRGGELLLHQLVVQQLVLGNTLQVRQSGAVTQHVADRDLGLAVDAELGPVRRDGFVVGQQPAVDQPVKDRGRRSLGG
jgi:hypothetical protein